MQRVKIMFHFSWGLSFAKGEDFVQRLPKRILKPLVIIPSSRGHDSFFSKSLKVWFWA
jgi:hypothetical protein